jgi:uncharacterized protein (UPF0264 family)
MSGFLASVRTVREALIVLENHADIIDFKEPGAGALGALPGVTIEEAVRAIDGRALTSATIGDLDLAPDLVVQAVRRTAATGVDFVKIGLFPGDLAGTLKALTPLASSHRLIAVAFADRAPDLALVEQIAAAGFAGCMLDTAEKSAGPLTAHMSLRALGEFVGRAQVHGLIAGLAGSLRLEDIAVLRPIGPDYIGFRSAMTRGQRDGPIDPGKVAAIRRALGYKPAASKAIEEAGAASAASSATSPEPEISDAKLA